MRISGDEKDNQVKLPSLLLWLKTIPSDSPIVHKVIKRVWFPNQFPNFTVDTESFRLRISTERFDETELTDFFESAVEKKAVLCIVVDPAKKGKWEVEELEGEIGEWDELGGWGYKCSVADKPKQPKQRVPKKPVQG